MAPAVSRATCSASHAAWARTFTGFLQPSLRHSMGMCRLVHQIAKERASTQTSPDLIEKADFSVVQLHFDGSNTCCVVHSVAPWCCGFTRRGLLVFLLREGYCGWGDVAGGLTVLRRRRASSGQMLSHSSGNISWRVTWPDVWRSIWAPYLLGIGRLPLAQSVTLGG